MVGQKNNTSNNNNIYINNNSSNHNTITHNSTRKKIWKRSTCFSWSLFIYKTTFFSFLMDQIFNSISRFCLSVVAFINFNKLQNMMIRNFFKPGEGRQSVAEMFYIIESLVDQKNINVMRESLSASPSRPFPASPRSLSPRPSENQLAKLSLVLPQPAEEGHICTHNGKRSWYSTKAECWQCWCSNRECLSNKHASLLHSDYT